MIQLTPLRVQRSNVLLVGAHLRVPPGNGQTRRSAPTDVAILPSEIEFVSSVRMRIPMKVPGHRVGGLKVQGVMIDLRSGKPAGLRRFPCVVSIRSRQFVVPAGDWSCWYSSSGLQFAFRPWCNNTKKIWVFAVLAPVDPGVRVRTPSETLAR
jgi:hypothetical protein